MIRLALIGLGKMGISHLAIVNSHPKVKVVGVCDSNSYVAGTLSKYTGIKVFPDYRDLLADKNLDAIVLATPPRSHGELVRAGLDRRLHVFCEKPFCLDANESAELAALAKERGLVNQVGYHYRFVGAFKEARRLLSAGVLGRVHHVHAEAYGPVVLRPKGATWRVKRTEGGGCLHDYACHAIDLMTYLVGAPQRVNGTMLNRIFSQDAEDEVYTNLYFEDGTTGQLSSNWSDESCRKMTTKVTVWGTNGRLVVDRQEIQLFLRDTLAAEPGLHKGWNLLYTTALTDEVWYYLRGEEYSAQIDHFVKCIETNNPETDSSFASAAATDRIVSLMLEDNGQRASNPMKPRLREAHVSRHENRTIFRRVRALLS